MFGKLYDAYLTNTMHPPFQKTLYRLENSAWHYIRLLWQETNQSFEVCTAPCGQLATSIRQEVLLPGETKETALHRLAVALRHAGYLEQPTIEWRLDVQVFTPVWDGFTAAAPWFDALQLDILYPLYAFLEDTANGGNSGGVKTEPICITHYLWVLNLDAATAALETIARQVPDAFRIGTNIREKTEQPVPVKLPGKNETTTLDPDLKILAGKLSDLTNVITTELGQILKPLLENQVSQDKTYPDNVCGFSDRSDPDRVRGQKAGQLRERLLTQWGVGKGYWPPLGKAASCETLHVEGLDDEPAAQLIAIIQNRIIGQVYAFDTSEGIFVSEPDRIFSRFMIDDTYWFDDGLEWVIFVSHENTVTFGGDWLLEEVRDVFQDQPENLNPWWNGPKSL